MRLILNDTSLLLRHINDADADVLFTIYSSGRSKELEATAWTDEQKHNFLSQQFTAQHAHYINNYPGADFWVILKDKVVIGRLYVSSEYELNNIRIIDITLLPEYRGKGVGRGIIKNIIDAAQEELKAVTIHVESFNPAMKMYEELGFILKDVTNGVYQLMEYKVRSNRRKPELV